MKTTSMAFLLLCCAGAASAQPVIDGTKDAEYGPAQWVNAANPTGFGDNHPTGGCNETSVGAPGAVQTGIEWAIPLSAIGNPSAASIKIGGFLTGGGYDYMSNQVIGGLPAGTLNLGESRAVNFTTKGQIQHVSGVQNSATAPVVDGTLDASLYGTALFVQTNRTGFGDNTNATGGANGSEIDALYATVSGGMLYVFVAGNLSSDFTKLSLFLDTVAGGQNVLRNDNADVDSNGLNRMGGPDAQGAGVTFDSGFAPDYWIGCTNGGAAPTVYANYARLRVDANDGGEAYYMGNHDVGVGPALAGGNNPNGIQIEINNSNIAGVPATCPPAAGTADFASGSEIDAVYATVHGARLYLLVTGNIESNYNKLDLFFDVDSANAGAGQNHLRANNVDIDFNGLNRYGAGTEGTGLTFDAGFTADYWVGVTNGGQVGSTSQYSNAAVLRTDGPLQDFNGNNLDYGAYDGGPRAQNQPIDYAGTRLDAPIAGNIFTNYSPRQAQLEYFNNPSAPSPVTDAISIAINNSNVDGVTSTTATDAAARAVSTGVEYEFRLDELGWDRVSPIKLAGWVVSGGHNYMSNQVIGGIDAAAGNVGEVRTVDFNNIAGNQYITLNVAPCAGDFNCDGLVDFNDYLDFVDRLSNNDTRANFNGDDIVDFNDYLDFVDALSFGCSN